jgi:hypothetical protein
MQSEGALDFLPIWALFLASLVMVIASVEVGYRVGRYRRKHVALEEKESTVGGMVGAALGLLAFLLAFTFSMSAARFDARKHVIVEEANAIGTCYLRADFLPDAERDAVRDLLREYVDLRITAVLTNDATVALQRSKGLSSRLWAKANSAGNAHPDSIVVGLFISSLNEVLDMHAKRVMVGLRSRIPGTIWGALGIVAVLSLAMMGYHGGLANTSRSWAVFAVALSFSTVLWLIADLDRPGDGFLHVNQQAMTDLRASMN